MSDGGTNASEVQSESIWCHHGRSGRAHSWEPGEWCPPDAPVPAPVLPAGRCEAGLKDGAGRCPNDARWSVLTIEREWELCGVHVRPARVWPNTLAAEPLDA